MAEGKVFLVGAGPGNPGLLTVRARELLESAETLVYDYLVHPAFFHLVPDACERICVGKRKGFHSKSQEEIQEVLLAQARAGRRVVRLKGGDPFLFGRGGEEARALAQAGLTFEVVPGVTAAMGAAAFAGIPLTDRNTNATLIFVTGHEDPEKADATVDWSALPSENATLCIYMGVANLERIAERLVSGGFSPEVPVACVEWATLGHQRICRGKLSTIAALAKDFELRAPAIVIVGESVSMSEETAWSEMKPLSRRRFVVTRSRGQASELSEMLEKQGAEVIGLPLISISKAVDPQCASDVFAEIASYDWLVFTSPNGVRFFFEAFFEVFKDVRSLGFLRIAAVGRSTAKEIGKFYISTDLIPKSANAEALAQELVETESLDSAKVLVVTGNLARDNLLDKLEEARAIVDRFEVYRTEATDLSVEPAAKQFREQGADAIIFTSSSGVRSFLDQAGSLQLQSDAIRPKTASIGPITSGTMQQLGLPVDLESKEASLESLIQALVERFGK